MHFLSSKKLFIGVALLLGVIAYVVFHKPLEKIDYSSQVKPILNKNCIACHGGVKQKGGFSVLFREDAMANTKSGKPAIIGVETPQPEAFAAALSA